MSKLIHDSDLQDIAKHASESFRALQGQSIFVTGGTGFFGKWLVQALVRNPEQKISRIGILCRNPDKAIQECPWLDQPLVKLYAGDIRLFKFPEAQFDHVIHAAVAASAALNENNPVEMLMTNVIGTERALAFAKHCGAKNFLLTSSGAIYGKQPVDMMNVSENYQGAPNLHDSTSAYGEGKRCAELLAVSYSKDNAFAVKIARCYAFVAPYLSLDLHFAVGNFIGDCLNGKDILIQGDGSPYRSYMYGTDLVTWLLRVLTHGESGVPYNLGSDQAISIAELAHLVHGVAVEVVPGFKAKGTKVIVAKKPIAGQLSARYVPNVERAKSQLGLQLEVTIESAIKRTLQWHLL